MPRTDRGRLPTAEDYFPLRMTLTALRRAAAGCRACPLWERGTQTVFGEGLRRSRVMFVGEQPGDREDRVGRPFVGPAGRELDRALDEVGIERRDCYLTNVVKHFKWQPRGKRRLHAKPSAREIDACFPWLLKELEVVQPLVLVCLGATAAQAVLGRQFRVTRERGELIASHLAPHVTATVHPSSIIRIQDDEERRAARAAFLADMQVVAGALR